MATYQALKQQLIAEFNALEVEGLPPITELYELGGAPANLSCPLPSGQSVKLLNDKQIYLGTQVACAFDDGKGARYFGLVAGPDFLLVVEYGANGADPEIVIYKRR